jgi:ferric-dicitrate binding protein FerR (iron transport regulator)
MSDDYLWDRSGPPDPDVAKLEELLKPLAHDAPLDELRQRRRRRLAPWIVGSIVVAAAAGVALWFATRTHDEVAVACSGKSGFRFVGKGGAVACGDRQVATGVLPIGGVLDTGDHEADLTIADIGTAQLGPNTRVTLDRTGATGHHLSIDHGHMHARVAAPPRLFAVSTKAASIVDLGCEYTIDVDTKGAGTIEVRSGKVELVAATGAIVVVPAGTHAQIHAGQQPGLPIVDGTEPGVEDAVEAYLGGDLTAIEPLLDAATATDAITLVDLAIIDADHRQEVLDKLAELSPPPAGVTIESAMAGGKDLERWQDDVVRAHLATHAPAGKRSKAAPSKALPSKVP